MKTKYTVLLLLITAVCFSQPTQVLDINNSGGLGSNPLNLYVYNGLIYFSADDSSGSNSPGNQDLGRELWVSDGTPLGTKLLKDINPGSADSYPNSFFTYNNNLYFSANAGSGQVLFTTDGTEEGTIATGNGSISRPVELGGLIYHINSDNTLHEFNGTTSGPVPGSGVEYILNNEIIAFDGKIFCYMNNSSQPGSISTELYAYDPITDSFPLIKNINECCESDLSFLTILGSKLYFSAFSGIELWESDGIEIGTKAVIPELSGISGFSSLYAAIGKLFFSGYDDTPTLQLWVYDPSDDSKTNLSNFTGSYNTHDPSDYVELGGWLYYSGKESNINNKYLWRTDGNATYQLNNTIKDVDEIVVLNNKLYFEGDNGTDGNELFEFDPATLSINSISKTSVSVYPNPTSSFINIKSETAITKIEIFDLLGKQILTTGTQSQLDVSNYQSGIYLLKLYSDNRHSIKKIVIK
jgi:ELWxxDGT repeat protein